MFRGWQARQVFQQLISEAMQLEMAAADALEWKLRHSFPKMERLSKATRQRQQNRTTEPPLNRLL